MYGPLISFLWQHIKPYKWWYLLMMLAPFVTSFYNFAYNYAIKLFLDQMEMNSFTSYSNLILPISIFVLAQLMLDVFWRISDVAEWRSEPYVRRSILLYSYDYIQHHSFSFFQNNFTGTISSKLKGLLTGYDKFWAEMHHGISMRFFVIVVSLVVLSWIKLKLGLFILAWSLVYIPVMYTLSKRLNTLSFIESESLHSIFGQVADKVANMVTLFSFAGRQREYRQLQKEMTDDFIPKQVAMYKYSFRFQITGGIFYIVMFMFILFYMIDLRLAGEVSIGDFALVFGMALAVSENIWHLTVNLQEFARGMGDFASALSFLQVPQENQDKPGSVPLTIKAPSVHFSKIQFAFDDGKALFKALDIKINEGEKIGLVGETGAGKSSLVSLLLRYFQPDAGQILIDGQDIADVTQDSLRAQIAVIPQDTMLFHRTLMENIRYGRENATDEEVFAAARKAHIHDFVLTLPEGYETYVGERGIKLSGGQRQRIAIARAILKDAPILVLDEATSALDTQTEVLIQESLNLLIEDKSKTVIAIAHRLSTLKHMDRIIVLNKGEILEEGTHEELMSSEDSTYKKLWELQVI